jgi:hypothetical protein
VRVSDTYLEWQIRTVQYVEFATKVLSLRLRRRHRSTVSNCARTGLISGLDPPPSRRYRSLGGKNEKEDIASLGIAFGRLSLRRMRND